MAEKVPDFEFSPRPRAGGFNAKYPWTEWTDGSKWKIRADVDFTCKPRVMLQTLRTKARDLEMGVTCEVLRTPPGEPESTIVFQYAKKVPAGGEAVDGAQVEAPGAHIASKL